MFWALTTRLLTVTVILSSQQQRAVAPERSKQQQVVAVIAVPFQQASGAWTLALQRQVLQLSCLKHQVPQPSTVTSGIYNCTRDYLSTLALKSWQFIKIFPVTMIHSFSSLALHILQSFFSLGSLPSYFYFYSPSLSLPHLLSIIPAPAR